MKRMWFNVIILVSIRRGGSDDDSSLLGAGKRGADNTDYCGSQWECEGPLKHFMCEFKKNSKTEKCSKIVTQISDAGRTEVLTLVNEFRNKLAGGEESAFPDGAQNMQQITWDYKLEGFAEVYGSQCGSKKVPDLDPCAKTTEFQQFGGTRPLWGIIEYNIQEVVTGPEGWTSSLPNPEIIRRFEPIDGQDRLVPNYGSFTMLAWATTYKMGCSIIECTCGQVHTSKKLVCFFGPSGNIGGRAVFSEGEACKSCAKDTSCNSKSLWSKLCARKGDPVKTKVIFGLASSTSIHSECIFYLNLLTAIPLIARN